jgi:hypothetical protein
MNKILCLVKIKMATLTETFDNFIFQIIFKAEILMLANDLINRNLMRTQNKLMAKIDRFRNRIIKV